MFALITFIIDFIAELLGWSSFTFAVLIGVALLLGHKKVFIAWCFVGYAGAFLIIRIFIPEIYHQVVPVLIIMMVTMSIIFSRYEDCKNGKRWWTQ